nr:MAG TPA: hypothetical protein [Caudoviricetes sp.]
MLDSPVQPCLHSSHQHNRKEHRHDRRNPCRPPLRRPRQLTPPHRTHTHIPPH